MAVNWAFVLRKSVAVGVVVGLLVCAFWFVAGFFLWTPIGRYLWGVMFAPAFVVLVCGVGFYLACRELGWK